MKYKIAVVTILILSLSNLSFTIEKRSLQSILTRIGCKVIKRTVANPTKWEKEEFNLQVKQSFIVKFRAKDGLLYKFLVEEENFLTEDEAKKRLPRIKEFPPELKERYGTSVDKQAVEYVLREGFIYYNKVYTVSTFTNALELNGDLSRLREKLENEIKK